MSCSVAVMPMKSGSGNAPDRVRGLLAERRVGLVADHELVRGARELVGVTGEPGIRLDRHRVLSERLAPTLDRIDETVAVALRREVAPELVDEQAPVGEDQDAELARRLDEPCGGDRLAGRGWVAEAVAPRRAQVLADEGGILCLLVLQVDVVVVLVLRLLDQLGDRSVAGAVAVLLGAPLRCGDELGEHSREGVDLMAAERGSGRGGRVLGREHPLEAQHQAVAHLPARRRRRQAGLDLQGRVVERATAGGARRQRDLCVFAGMEERLAEPALRALRSALQGQRGLGRGVRDDRGFLHLCSSLETRRSVVANVRGRQLTRALFTAPASLHSGM